MGLLPLVFRPLAPGRVRAAGWLERQLRLQAQGLTGHLDEFWAVVAKSQWIGGDADGWELGPYWLDGVVALAFALDDEKLQAKARRWVDYILEHQSADGWLGPTYKPALDVDPRRVYDTWPRFLVFKALVQWQEATGDSRIIPAMLRGLRCIGQVIEKYPSYEWGQVRWADLVLSIHWLYEKTGEPWLLELAEKVRGQGYDWVGHFADFKFTEAVTEADLARWKEEHGGHFGNLQMMTTHIVNNTMGIKSGAVWYRQSGDARDRDSLGQALAALDRYHGRPTGMISGDEHLAGLHPTRGTELCAVVEMMYSLEAALAVLGEAGLADRLERVAYNALPATISEDMWSHQYVQMGNQIKCTWMDQRVYVNNSEDANRFGLEPNFPCCTANMHQGWPKFVQHLWMASADGGLAAAAWGPCRVETEVGGAPVTITVDTEYPFEDEVHVRVETRGTKAFPLHLRVPEWARGVGVAVDGVAWDGPVEPGKFLRMERCWTGRHEVRLQFGMETRCERRMNGAIAVHLGPLVYALQIGEQWRQVGRELPAADWDVLPTTPWNVALMMDPQRPEEGWRFEKRGVGAVPFSAQAPPCVMEGEGVVLPQWQERLNGADTPPPSPVVADGERVKVQLVPYGCARLRLSEMPWAKR